MREFLQTLPIDDHAEFSAAMDRRLMDVAPFRGAKRVLEYSPLRGEPALMATSLNTVGRRGAVLYLPRFNPATETYEAAHAPSLERLVKGPFGVWEPDAGCSSIPLNQLDFVLVPGLAFDLTGRRLGRGKGFYDRLLAEVRGHKCGVAFDRQLVAELPEEPHDVRVDSILTPTQWLPARAD